MLAILRQRRERVAASLARTDSLIATARTVGHGGHSLQPIDLGGAGLGLVPALESVADPDHAMEAPAFLQNVVGARPRGRRLGRLLKVIGIGLVVVALAVAWHLTPLATLTDPDYVRQWFADIAEMPGAPLIVLVAFVVGGLLVFPVMLLIAATRQRSARGFGLPKEHRRPCERTVTYAIGFAVGRRTVRPDGSAFTRVRRGSAARRPGRRRCAWFPSRLYGRQSGCWREPDPSADYIFGTIGMAPGMF